VKIGLDHCAHTIERSHDSFQRVDVELVNDSLRPRNLPGVDLAECVVSGFGEFNKLGTRIGGMRPAGDESVTLELASEVRHRLSVERHAVRLEPLEATDMGRLATVAR
jgi:hypothetical protein